MKIIFLDIDGVLNSQNSIIKSFKISGPKSCKRVDFCPDAVRNLNILIHQTEAEICVSSTWRFGETIESLQKILNKSGVKGRVRGMTGDLRRSNGLYVGDRRGCEIQAWIDKYREKINLENYVIIDDDADMLDSQINNFVQTSFIDGFANAECLMKALDILKNKEKYEK